MSNTVKQEDYKEDLEMMKSPWEWIRLVLPVMSRDGSLKCGVLTGDKPVVYEVNMWEIRSREDVLNAPKHKYQTYEELVKEWRVD